MKYVIRQALVIWLAAIGSIAVCQEAKQPEATGAGKTVTEAESAAVQDDSAQISAASQAYLDAFNAQDVPKLVALWSPEGVYVSRTSGDRVVGRERLTEEFSLVFAGQSKPKLSGSTESIEFVSPNVALERGTATVTNSDDTVTQTNYRIVYVNRDGTWLIDRVTEDEIIVPLSNYQHLQDLEWMIGDWVDAGEGTTIAMECNWTTNQNFISRKYSVSTEDRVASTGLQIIGWDAKQQQIRSWLFDSDGGVITGQWTNGGDHWTVQSVATLPDGASGSFTSVFRPTDDGNYTWQKINRVLAGRLLPNIDEIVVQRK